LDGWMVLPAIGGPRLRAAWATCRYEGARKRPVRDASPTQDWDGDAGWFDTAFRKLRAGSPRTGWAAEKRAPTRGAPTWRGCCGVGGRGT